MLAYRGFPSSPKKKTTFEKPLCVEVPQSRVLEEKDGSRKNKMKEDITVSRDNIPPDQQKASLLGSSHTRLSFGCIPFLNVQLV